MEFHFDSSIDHGSKQKSVLSISLTFKDERHNSFNPATHAHCCCTSQIIPEFLQLAYHTDIV